MRSGVGLHVDTTAHFSTSFMYVCIYLFIYITACHETEYKRRFAASCLYFSIFRLQAKPKHIKIKTSDNWFITERTDFQSNYLYTVDHKNERVTIFWIINPVFLGGFILYVYNSFIYSFIVHETDV